MVCQLDRAPACRPGYIVPRKYISKNSAFRVDSLSSGEVEVARKARRRRRPSLARSFGSFGAAQFGVRRRFRSKSRVERFASWSAAHLKAACSPRGEHLAQYLAISPSALCPCVDAWSGTYPGWDYRPATAGPLSSVVPERSRRRGMRKPLLSLIESNIISSDAQTP